MGTPAKTAKVTLGLAALLLGAFAGESTALACSPTETQVYQSSTTVWCVESSVITKYGTFPSAFFSYGDNVIKELATLFKVPPQGVYTFEASIPNGSAHTGSECCGLGVTVTGDAFYNSAYGATGFWGYLLSLHESINDWTGQVTGGWPTDFWADHVSAFPNSMDWHIMATLGTLDQDANLTKASAAQKTRFYPGGDSVDPRVPMFDTIFALPGVDYAGLSRVFGFIEGDKLSWDGLGVPNPDQKRSEYVAAYLSLGPGQSILPTFQGAGVCAGKPDGQNDPTYTCDEAHVDAIATAHCSIAAAAAKGVDETADRAALRAGNYAGVMAKGPCGAGCPAECGCKTSSNLCVAPWLGDAPVDAGLPEAGGAEGGAGDAGADAASPLDAGAGGPLDGGATEDSGGNGATAGGGTPATSGCACGVLGPARAPFVGTLVVAGCALLVSRRRGRPGRERPRRRR